jgi:predicted nucleic acid-binding protein
MAISPNSHPLFVLDANCFIVASGGDTAAQRAVVEILTAAQTGVIKVGVSKHTIHEIARGTVKYGPAAEHLATSVAEIPYYPLGTIKELLGTWSELAGTWDDARVNEQLQVQLTSLAKAGNDLRDRGAVVDALRAGATAFVTWDRQLVGPGPAARIHEVTGLRILTPEQVIGQYLR